MAPQNKVDITGLDKRVLLRKLWESSKSAPFFAMSNIPPHPLSESEIDKVFEMEEPYADYLSGRVIKTRFTTDLLDPWGYDRDNGSGAMQKVVDSMRKENLT